MHWVRFEGPVVDSIRFTSARSLDIDSDICPSSMLVLVQSRDSSLLSDISMFMCVVRTVVTNRYKV